MSSTNLSDHTNKKQWDLLTNANSIVIGDTTIIKNTNPDYGVVGNALVNTSNNMTQFASNVGDTVAYPFRASNGSTLMSKVQTAQFGKFQIGSTVDSAVDSISNFLSPVTDAATKGIDATASVVSGVAKGVGNFTDVAAKRASNYIAPVTETIDKINKIGSEFNKIIKDTFLGQVFKIKGTEILCAMFCLVISMLSCDQRDSLAKAVLDAKTAIKSVNATIDGVKAMSLNAGNGPVEVPLFNKKTIADNVRGMFSTDQQRTNFPDKMLNIPKNTRTVAPVVTVTLPSNVSSTVARLIQILSMMANGKITVPTGLTGNIWDIAQAALHVLQTQAVQMADEFLTKVVKDVEKLLKGIMPQICVGNLASMFINKITDAVKQLKLYLLKQIKALFGESKGFSVKWTTFAWHLKGIQDLLAMLKALALVLKHFPDLALQCGVQPCTQPLPGSELKEIQDAVRNGMMAKETNEPASIAPADETPQGKTLDELASVFGGSVIPTTDGFNVVMPQMYQDTPQQIRDLLLSPEFLVELGGAYTVYAPADLSFVNIVYTYRQVCS